MDREVFNKLKIKITKDTEVTPDNVETFSIKIPKLYFQLLDMYSNEKKILSEQRGLLAKTYKELIHYYKFDADFEIGKTKSDLESYVFGDDKYYNQKLEYDFQSIVVEYLEKTLDTVQKINFFINNHVAFLKIKHGFMS